MTPVFVVGAGPAGPEYLTVRAVQLLAEAEVVVADDLVDPRVLALVPEAAERPLAGRRAGQAGPSPQMVAELLLDRWRAGRTVVRLKAGDPFIFGRCGDELVVLAAAGCPFEVVPGVSAALAAPLFAGIPLTDRAWGRNFCILSAHDLETLPWRALAAIDTLVVLMGNRQLSAIAGRLMDSGRPASMPAAIIRWAGRPEQHTTVTTLGELVEPADTTQPTVAVIGPVVNHRSRFAWFDRRPLFGRRLLVTRAVDQAGEWVTHLRTLGAQVWEMPTLVVTPPSSWEPLDRAIGRLGAYRWLFLSSANGVEAFFGRLDHHGFDLRALAGMRVALVGPRTARVASRFGLRPDFIPTSAVADALLAEFPDRAGLSGAEVLCIRVETGGRELLGRTLEGWGALVDEVPGYDTGCPTSADPTALAALDSGSIDCLTFASSKTVHHFAKLVGQERLKHLAGVCVASIGPQTSTACREVFGRVDIEAQTYTLDGLTEAIIDHWAAPATDATLKNGKET